MRIEACRADCLFNSEFRKLFNTFRYRLVVSLSPQALNVCVQLRRDQVTCHFEAKVSKENFVISVATTYPNMHHIILSQWCECA